MEISSCLYDMETNRKLEYDYVRTNIDIRPHQSSIKYKYTYITRSAFKKRRGWCLVKMNVQLLTQFIEVCLLIRPSIQLVWNFAQGSFLEK